MKLRNKLLLSCAALAACATTMVSTTFAWYTSNTTVTAEGVTGTTSASGSELLLIRESEADPWATTVANVTESGANTAMKPLQYLVNGGGTAAVLAALDQTEESVDYLSFTLFLKNASTKEGNINMTIKSLKNTTGVTDEDPNVKLPAKSIIAAGASHVGLAESAREYKVDMLRVLCMEIESIVTTNGVAAEETSKVYDLEAVTNTQTFKDDIQGKTFDAIKYYNAIMGPEKALKKSVDDTAFTAKTADNVISLGALPTAGTSETSNSFMKLTFKLFLNGWDKACFDAVQGQTFALDLSFSVVE